MNTQKIRPGVRPRPYQAHVPTTKLHWLNSATETIINDYLCRNLQELTPNEYRLFQFIQARTLRYGKEAERIPLRHFTEGVVTRDGRRIISGVGLSICTVRKALSSLIEKGFIRRAERQYDHGGTDAPEYSIAIERFTEDEDAARAAVDRAVKVGTALQVTQGNDMPILEHLKLGPTAREANGLIVNRSIFKIMNSKIPAPARGDEVSIEDEEEENTMHLKLPKNPKKSTDSVEEGRGYKLRTPKKGNYVPLIDKGIKDKSFDLSSSSRSSTTSAKTNGLPTVEDREDFAIDCTPPRRTDDAALRAVEKVTARSRKRAADALHSYKTIKSLTKEQLQAMIRQYVLIQPEGVSSSVVDGKAFGYFKKQVIKHEIEDLHKFMEFVGAGWATIVDRRNWGVAQARKIHGAIALTEKLPDTFDMKTLAYRFSTFARAYAQHQAGGQTFAARSVQAEQMAEMKDEIKRLKKHNEHLRGAHSAAVQSLKRSLHKERAVARGANSPFYEPKVFDNDDEVYDDE